MKREEDDWEARNMIHKDVKITVHSPQIDITGNKLSRTSPTQRICIFFPETLIGVDVNEHTHTLMIPTFAGSLG